MVAFVCTHVQGAAGSQECSQGKGDKAMSGKGCRGCQAARPAVLFEWVRMALGIIGRAGWGCALDTAVAGAGAAGEKPKPICIRACVTAKGLDKGL
ncbi:hypothetical protein GCM10027514_08840 [Azotobacter armeniacus]